MARGSTADAAVGLASRPRIKPPIQEIFRRGDEVLVQVIKEGIGTKGPTLSTYISIPGRYLVLMPALGRVGVSRKIEDEDDRRKLRDTLLELNPPKGWGSSSAPPARTEPRRNCRAIWRTCCDCGRSSCAGSKNMPRPSISTKKAT